MVTLLYPTCTPFGVHGVHFGVDRVDLVSVHILGYETGPQKTSKDEANEREQEQKEFENFFNLLKIMCLIDLDPVHFHLVVLPLLVVK